MKNKVGLMCKLCGDIIFSTSRHDFKSCRCGKCSIDGGNIYLKISGNEGDFITINLPITNEIKKVWDIIEERVVI